ncbi:MAG: DeoR/GlpR family DNA-binding transcription regulator [Lachnospiraceae bacterium]|nr:DeoR/GlpR family DNA-binding transcription regulator [Lachnospiraceae bacterium]
MINRNIVLQYINDKQHVTVAQMCNDLSISASTARRSIAQLESLGKIHRFHGGAYSLREDIETLVAKRQKLNTNNKAKIAKQAATLIKNNSTVILLSGSTVGFICQYIKKKKITIITNSLIVLNELKALPNIRLIALGGLYNHEESEFGGVLSHSSLSYLRADLLFMGCSGFDENHGFTNRNHSIALYRFCIQASKEVCVLVDSSKYNQGGVSIAAKPNQVKYLISDSKLGDEAVKAFQDQGSEVILT